LQGIANICYHRDILPLDNFETVKINGLESKLHPCVASPENQNGPQADFSPLLLFLSAEVDAKMLVTGKSASEETKVINDWLNKSCNEALKTGYVTKVRKNSNLNFFHLLFSTSNVLFSPK
jgi:hypothetical protein